MRPRVVEGLAHVLIVTENEAQICLLPNYCFLCPDITSKCHIYFKKNSSMVTQKEERKKKKSEHLEIALAGSTLYLTFRRNEENEMAKVHFLIGWRKNK